MKTDLSWLTGLTKGTAVALYLSLSVALVPDVKADEFTGAGDDLLFEDSMLLGTDELARSSGGTAINVGDLGLNIASNSATVNGNTVDGVVTTGQIKDNNLTDVTGINSLMFNTGNNVNFQSNMQINIFLK